MTSMSDVPYTYAQPEGLTYVAVEISYGGQWVDLNDSEKFRIEGSSKNQANKTWRKITAQSPVLAGTYLVHAVPELISEQVAVWVLGEDQTDLADNFFFLDELFEQPNFQLRWTFNEYRETWDCQLADASFQRSQVLTHSTMALSTYTVPRFPRVTRERV